MSRAVMQQALEALVTAEAGLADIGDADRDPTDDLAWCEERAAQALAKPRVAIAAIKEALAQQDAESHLQAVSDFGQLQEPFGYFKPETFGWTDCAETDEGAIPLYEKPFGMRQPLTDTDRPVCLLCSGSGEGQFDGMTCRGCLGSGEV